MATPVIAHSLQPVRSYILRVVRQRTTAGAVVYELHPIGTGARRRFLSLAALKRHLGRLGGREA